MTHYTAWIHFGFIARLKNAHAVMNMITLRFGIQVNLTELEFIDLSGVGEPTDGTVSGSTGILFAQLAGAPSIDADNFIVIA